MAEGTPLMFNGKAGNDPFSNFELLPPKPSGKYRPYARRTKFRAMGALCMTPSRSSITGSAQDLLDPSKLMALQEDAKSRRISSEIMKHHLYESVLLPSHRRKMAILNNSYMDGITHHTEDLHSDEVTRLYMHPTRMAISVPVTPSVSTRTTPCHSPTQNRSFMFSLFPRHYAEEQEQESLSDSTRGLASLFSPQPRYVPAARWTPRVDREQKEEAQMERKADNPNGVVSPIVGDGSDPTMQSFRLQDVPKPRNKAAKQRSPSPMDDEPS